MTWLFAPANRLIVRILAMPPLCLYRFDSMRSLIASCVLLVAACSACISVDLKPDPYLDGAIKAGTWLQAKAIETPNGFAWAADPTDSTTVLTHLYSGSSGVVLFFLEAYLATNDPAYLDYARAGADYLHNTLPDSLGPSGSGLYTGVAGLGYVLYETYKATNDRRYTEAASQTISLLKQKAETTEHGVMWNPVTDIVSGSAGTGLYLLYAAREMHDAGALELAKQVGDHLISNQIETPNGAKWAMTATFPRLMPNFSHGTGGVAYFLTELYRATEDSTFLNAALAGAHYLHSVTADDGLIFHHEPEGEDLFYLSWCHGPPGTARLYYRLWQITQDDTWLNAVHTAAESIMHTGIPEQQTPGFWNNVSQCCGSAGVATFFLDLYRATNRQPYLDFAHHVTNNLLTRAAPDSEGFKWIQAENRTQPDVVKAQTGFMQGASGIGIALLQLSAHEHGRSFATILPDSPWEW